MRWLLFLSRVAFICNLFFLLSALLQWKDFIGSHTIVSTIVVIGYFLSVFIFSPLINLLYAGQAIIKKNLFNVVPKWLVIVNFIFLLIQLLFILFFLNDTFYY